MRAALIGNASSVLLTDHIKRISSSDLVIAADGAADICFRFGIVPDWIVGDMDSISPTSYSFFQSKAVQFRSYPVEKDQTDIELAFKLALELGASELDLFAWADERLDFSFECLRKLCESPAGVQLHAQAYRSHIVNSFRPIFEMKSAAEVSIMTLKSPVKLKTHGLKWELDWNSEAYCQSQSNRVLGESFRLELEEGSCLILIKRSSDKSSGGNSPL